MHPWQMKHADADAAACTSSRPFLGPAKIQHVSVFHACRVTCISKAAVADVCVSLGLQGGGSRAATAAAAAVAAHNAPH